MKTFAVSLLVIAALLASSSARLSAQTLTYQLLPGSTITPTNGATPTGPSEALTGSFTWTSDPGNSDATIIAFNIVSLSLTSAQFDFSLVTPSPINETLTTGDASFGANTNLSGVTNGAYSLLSFSTGSYTGPASAPTELFLPSLGLAPSTGGLDIAHANITALLTPEPGSAPLALMTLAAMALLAGARMRSAWAR